MNYKKFQYKCKDTQFLIIKNILNKYKIRNYINNIQF